MTRRTALAFLKKAIPRLYVAASIAAYLLAVYYVERMRK